MAKTTVMKKKQRDIPEFNFASLMMDSHSPDDEIVLGIVSGIIEAYHHQQQTAIELTRLVVEKNVSANMSEEEIFSTFKRASQVVSEISPIKELLEKIRD